LLFIVGCPRSGTSLSTKLLASAGLSTFQDVRKNRDYPSGCYEHLPLSMFHRALEQLLRGADHRITAEPFLKADYREDDFIRQMYQSACEPILNGSVDFVKYLQLALSTDFLFEQFGDVHVIGLWRNPECTFRSVVTKELPREMLPASGLKAIVLWSVYASHLVRAKKKHPERVTVLCIDDLVENDTSISPLLRRQGYSIWEEYCLSQCIEHNIWTRRIPWPWKLCFQPMRLSCLAIRRYPLVDKGDLANLAQWLRRLVELAVEI
jgi:hypothetical protein